MTLTVQVTATYNIVEHLNDTLEEQLSDTPDYVPMLIKGMGCTPQEGGCIVQIANWLSDNSLWTDRPVCVHPVLAKWAITINDLISEEARRKLALLAPRLTDTSIADKFQSGEVSLSLLNWYRDSNQMPIGSILRGPTMNEGVPTVWLEYVITDENQAIEWLSAALDEYDRLVDRQPVPLLTEEQGRSLCEVMGQ